MKTLICLVTAILLSSAITNAQSKPNESIARQLKALGAESTITLTHDSASNMSKVMAVSGNFSDAEAKGCRCAGDEFCCGLSVSGAVAGEIA
jgi:hypothetical protein